MTHRSQLVARGDEVIEQGGDFRFWHIAPVSAVQRYVRRWGRPEVTGRLSKRRF
jgi:hypothetical protein